MHKKFFKLTAMASMFSKLVQPFKFVKDKVKEWGGGTGGHKIKAPDMSEARATGAAFTKDFRKQQLIGAIHRFKYHGKLCLFRVTHDLGKLEYRLNLVQYDKSYGGI